MNVSIEQKSAGLEGLNNKEEPLIGINGLVKHFPIRGGIFQRTQAWLKAVDGVSFTILPGETLGLVGESGCGKTTVGQTILRLQEPTQGTIIFDGQDVSRVSKQDLRELRRNMQIIFQDPYSSLNPRIPVGESIGEGLLTHGMRNKKERNEIIFDALRRVGLESYHARRYPHEFSGGQRQRIGIARAIVLEPKFIVCDEPVSALDVSVQSQVLNLLRKLQQELGLAYLFIAHDLSVVEHISDRVAVMYLGKIVELTDRKELYRNPLHPYTQALISSIPVPDPHLKRERVILKGEVPSPIDPPSGCRFHPRCPLAIDRCKDYDPEFKEASPGHWAACILLE